MNDIAKHPQNVHHQGSFKENQISKYLFCNLQSHLLDHFVILFTVLQSGFLWSYLQYCKVEFCDTELKCAEKQKEG